MKIENPSQNKAMVSKEILNHFNCNNCKKWWSIGDAPKGRKKWWCPWCGLEIKL